MKFVVSEKVFEELEDVFFGVVIATGIDNTHKNAEIHKLLEESMEFIRGKFKDKKVKECDEVLYYREAFQKLGINPNKFMSSIEAMITRVAKNNSLPTINSIVDLGNVVSLKHCVPLGAHDLDSAKEDIQVRFSALGDRFIPFGESEPEILEDGELIYSVGNRVKTRRWIWRQSEEGKITTDSKNIFFPIDGFTNRNYEAVMGARDELATLLKQLFHCEIRVGVIDKNNRELEI